MATAADRDTGPAPRWQEVYLGGSPQAEAELFARFQVEIRGVQDRNRARAHATHANRAFHAKTLAAVDNASFLVPPDIAPDLRIGLFQPGATYRATVRLSNASGTPQPDSKKDLRGAAVRVHGPAGDQDFLLTNAPASHARDAIQFMAQAEAAAASRGAIGMLLRLIPKIGLRETLRMASTLRRAVSPPVPSVAAQSFWSRAAFAVGDHAVRFKLAPTEQGQGGPTPSEHDGLRDEFVTRLRAGPVTFSFQAQRFEDEEHTPIENGAKAWDERVTRPVVVAELTIPQQDLTSDAARDIERQVDALAFNPWNTPDGFRPLGSLNRARNPVYEASAAYRNAGEASPRRS